MRSTPSRAVVTKGTCSRARRMSRARTESGSPARSLAHTAPLRSLHPHRYRCDRALPGADPEPLREVKVLLQRLAERIHVVEGVRPGAHKRLAADGRFKERIVQVHFLHLPNELTREQGVPAVARMDSVQTEQTAVRAASLLVGAQEAGIQAKALVW